MHGYDSVDSFVQVVDPHYVWRDKIDTSNKTAGRVLNDLKDIEKNWGLLEDGEILHKGVRPAKRWGKIYIGNIKFVSQHLSREDAESRLMILAHKRIARIKEANGWVDEGRPRSRPIDCADLREELQHELEAAKRLAILDSPQSGKSAKPRTSRHARSSDRAFV